MRARKNKKRKERGKWDKGKKKVGWKDWGIERGVWIGDERRWKRNEIKCDMQEGKTGNLPTLFLFHSLFMDTTGLQYFKHEMWRNTEERLYATVSVVCLYVGMSGSFTYTSPTKKIWPLEQEREREGKEESW